MPRLMTTDRAALPVRRVDIGSFEEKYRQDGDPWKFATSSYEQRRYELIMAMLPRQRYRRCFEPGASIGELTRRLALRCDEVIAAEASATAVSQAEHLLAGKYPTASVVQQTVPDWMPDGPFDLIILSEFGYYFDGDGLRALVNSLDALLDAKGTLVVAHWRGVSADHLMGGDEVHEIARETLRDRRGAPDCVYTERDVRIDVWGTA